MSGFLIRSRAKLYCLIWFFVIVYGLTQAQESEAAEAVKTDLVMGRITADPNSRHEELRPILDYVVARMADIGITEGRIRMARDNREMLRMLARGEVDWLSETLISALVMSEEGEADIFLRRWKDGTPSYSSVILVNKDSGIESLPQLVGHTIAFEDAGSTSAFFLPALALVESGLELEQLNTPRERPLANRVGYVFSQAEINTATWVSRNIVSAGGLSKADWENESKVPLAQREFLKIVHETDEVPRAVELVRRDLDPVFRDRLAFILLNMEHSEEGRRALSLYEDTTRFDEFGQDELKQYAELKQRIDQLYLR